MIGGVVLVLESVESFCLVGAQAVRVEDAVHRPNEPRSSSARLCRLLSLDSGSDLTQFRVDMTNAELRAALIKALPSVAITREMIHSADARWSGYDEPDQLGVLEGKSWLELAPETLECHRTLLVHAGSALYRAILPAYLLLLAERDSHTSLRFHVASQVTRKESAVDREIFEERVGPMTDEQRSVVRQALELLAERELPFHDALRSW